MIERARAGDHAAVEALVRRYEDLAFRVAYVITGDAEEARDAAQSAFIKAYLALPRFRAGAPLRPWLLRIVANEARNRRTAASRRPALALTLVSERPAEGAESEPEAWALREERRATLLTAVQGLREEERLVVACRYLLDLPEAECAETLGVPRGTVKSRLARALGRIRAAMAAADGAAVDAAQGREER